MLENTLQPFYLKNLLFKAISEVLSLLQIQPLDRLVRLSHVHCKHIRIDLGSGLTSLTS